MVGYWLGLGRGRRATALLLGFGLVFACGDDDTDDTDEPVEDMGSPVDMSAPETDGGPEVVDCSEATGDDFYSEPDGLPEFSATERGRLVRCGSDPMLDAATLDSRARRPVLWEADEPDNYTGPALANDANVFRIGYRSERRNGAGAYASGTLYLPTEASDMPLLVYVSGTTGLGDDCAPSRRRFRDLERAVPLLVGSGVPVLVPDLIGLGTPGSYAYLDAVEAAHSVLDGARAALDAAPEGVLDGQILVAGHSAGGHAALATQALQREYAPELDVVGTAGVAPAWFDLSVFGQVFLTPERSIDPSVNGNTASFITMFYVGVGAAYDGEDVAWNPIAADLRADTMAAFENGCIEDPPTMTDNLFTVASTIGELYDDAFGASLRSCGFGVCNGAGELWYGRFPEQRPDLDPDGPESFILASDVDPTIPIGDLERVIEDSGFGTGCCLRDAAHSPTATRAAPWLIDWVMATEGGDPAPACAETFAECMGG